MFIYVLISVFHCGNTQTYKVIGGNVTVVEGDTAILPCNLKGVNEILSQISWQRKTRKKPQTDHFFTILEETGPSFVNGKDLRFKFIGDFDQRNGSLQLSNVTLDDEGNYSCIFTLFPSGNHKVDIPLNLLVPPVTYLEYDDLTLGSGEVALVTCVAAASRPPAEVKFIGSLVDKLKVTVHSTQHANGTTTTRSSLFGVPTREFNGQQVTCVASSAALLKHQSRSIVIRVLFPPVEVKIIYISEETIECIAEANPEASFNWTRSGQTLPQSDFRVEGGKLQFLSWTSELNGLYKCEASNQYGKKQHQLFVHVASGTCTAGWVLFALLLLLNVVAVAALWYNFWYLPRTNGDTNRGDRQSVPTSSNSPERVSEDILENETGVL